MPLVRAPSDEEIRELLRKQGLPNDQPVENVMLEGVACHTRLCGDACIKLLKEQDFRSDMYCEVAGTPLAKQAGCLVPQLLAFDDSGELHPGPVSFWQRGSGDALGNLTHVLDLEAIYVQLAQEARLWHDRVEVEPHPWLDEPECIVPAESLARMGDRMSFRVRAWCEKTFERLDKAPNGPPAFAHCDLHAHNILVQDGRLSMILDWGDAGFGDPILNFTCFPAEFLPEVVAAFGIPDPGFIGRLLREVIAYAINAYGVPDQPTLRHTGMKRWKSLERLYAQNLTDEWNYWLGDPMPNL